MTDSTNLGILLSSLVVLLELIAMLNSDMTSWPAYDVAKSNHVIFFLDRFLTISGCTADQDLIFLCEVSPKMGA